MKEPPSGPSAKSLAKWGSTGVKLAAQVMHVERIGGLLGKARSVGMRCSFAASAAVCVGYTGYFFLQWMRNEISGTEFASKTLIEFISTGASLAVEVGVFAGLSALAGTAVIAGAALTPVGWVILGVSVIKDTDEERAKANQVAQAIILLNLYEPDINRLDVEQIRRQYHKQVLQNFHWHEDRLPQDATEDQRRKATSIFQTINLAKDILITVCENRNLFSRRVRNLIKDRVGQMKRMTIEEFVDSKLELAKPIVKDVPAIK